MVVFVNKTANLFIFFPIFFLHFVYLVILFCVRFLVSVLNFVHFFFYVIVVELDNYVHACLLAYFKLYL